MRAFLNVQLLHINRTYQMFAHHSFVLPYPLVTVCSYSEEVEITKHYSTSNRYDSDAKMNEFKHIKWFLRTFGTLNTTVQVLEKILMLK